MAVNIDDAGFEIRDMIAWVYGSGFPKSLNIGKAVDKLQGNERIKTGEIKHHAQKGVAVAEERGAIGGGAFGQAKDEELTKGTSQWEGWGTALKPALEPITVARKPISEKNIAENVLKWNVGGLNIDECRVGTEQTRTTIKDLSQAHGNQFGKAGIEYPTQGYKDNPPGRFPANFIHDGSDEVVELFPTKGEKSEARFFYCAKASKRERNIGCEGLEEKPKVFNGQSDKPSEDMKDVEKRFTTLPVANFHPTVKPLALMEYLVKLVSRERQVVLDPFMGSGTTGMACVNTGRDFIGIEIDEDYFKIAQARIESCKESRQLTFE
jgi:site-specific DNA-methyltransferase (adenine-specific)